MQNQFSLGEQENFEAPRTVRRESRPAFNSYPSEGTEPAWEPKSRQGDSHSGGPARDAGKCDDERRTQGSNKFPCFLLPDDPKITISVVEGPSKGLAYKLDKVCITMGRIGGGADFEFDEEEASDVQCIVAARAHGIRLYDGASVSGTYVNDKLVSTVELKHMSTFRVGSSLLQVRIVPNEHSDIA